ncbi:MAG: L-lactate dehydrogenase [Alphaproteobacteria bacterium]|nr:L-lactate dehydrogenase [Alphaproteobacteria bacterium]MBQ7660320.1 L-lactate dehydrogenase [Alphaproteobacteria bacterium]
MKKVTVIGAGLVGSTIAYTLMLKNLADKIALVDVDEKRVRSEVLDLRHGHALLSHADVVAGTYQDCKDSDLVIITAGLARKTGETRLDLLYKNKAIMQSICKQINKSGFNGVALVVSNPVDALTNVAASVLKVKTNKVFGSGCVVDSSRFKALLAERLKVDVKNISANVVGEHGENMVLDFEGIKVNGKKYVFTQKQKNELTKAVRTTGMQIIEGKGKTYYGIALSVAAIARAVLKNKPALLSVSVPNKNKEAAVVMMAKVDAGGLNLSKQGNEI